MASNIKKSFYFGNDASEQGEPRWERSDSIEAQFA